MTAIYQVFSGVQKGLTLTDESIDGIIWAIENNPTEAVNFLRGKTRSWVQFVPKEFYEQKKAEGDRLCASSALSHNE